jgi:hypothetical protein
MPTRIECAHIYDVKERRLERAVHIAKVCKASDCKITLAIIAQRTHASPSEIKKRLRKEGLLFVLELTSNW